MFLKLLIILKFLHISIANFERPEGEPCTEKGVAGTCRHIRFCPTVTLVDLKYHKEELPQVCSYVGKEPIVCCTDCNQTDVTKMVLTRNGIQYKLGTNKAHDHCLDYISSLPYPCNNGVKGVLDKTLDEKKMCYYLEAFYQYSLIGKLAKRGEFPHMALLGYGEEAAAAEWLCGGSVISNRFILTAGHCGQHSQLGPVSHAALGILRRSDPADEWQRRRVRRFISHPEYMPPSKYNDIALIETDEEIKFSVLVLPICLPHRELKEEHMGQVEGWGSEGFHKRSSDGLRKASLERFSDEECDSLYPKHRNLLRGVDRATQVCYGDHEEDKDTCEGDSGGPLQVQSSNDSCVQYVVGVTSYGRACGFRGNAGVYTRVLPYLPWIEGHVWP